MCGDRNSDNNIVRDVQGANHACGSIASDSPASTNVGAVFEWKREGGGATALDYNSSIVGAVGWLVVLHKDLVTASVDFTFYAERNL